VTRPITPDGRPPVPEVQILGENLLFRGGGVLEVLAGFNSRVREVRAYGAQPSPRLLGMQRAAAVAAHGILGQAELMSHPRQRDTTSTDVQQDSTQTVHIGTKEAAQMLGVTQRQAQRLAATLDGRQLANGHLVFDRLTVQAYALAARDNQRPTT